MFLSHTLLISSGLVFSSKRGQPYGHPDDVGLQLPSSLAINYWGAGVHQHLEGHSSRGTNCLAILLPKCLRERKRSHIFHPVPSRKTQSSSWHCWNRNSKLPRQSWKLLAPCSCTFLPIHRDTCTEQKSPEAKNRGTYPEFLVDRNKCSGQQGQGKSLHSDMGVSDIHQYYIHSSFPQSLADTGVKQKQTRETDEQESAKRAQTWIIEKGSCSCFYIQGNRSVLNTWKGSQNNTIS